MRITKDTPFELSLMPWELEPPRTVAVMVVKGTFSLVDAGPARVADEQVPVLGEVPWDDGEPPSLRTETDYAVLKPRGEWYLTGHAYAAGSPVTVLPVRARVGPLEKQLAVWGDRVWRRGILGSAPSEPTPFERMPLRWERSFGGAGLPANPAGRGLAPVAGPEGPVDALPNLEEPSSPITSRDDRPRPAGMFAIPSIWRTRIEKTGTYDEAWRASRWPYFPRDFDFEFFCCAPPDQRLREGFFRGDEVIELAGLHPTQRRLASRLPGLRPRLFLERAQLRPPDAPPLELLSRAELEALGPPTLLEVPLQLDTVVIDTDASQVLCQWRGLVEVVDKQLTDVARVFVVHEPLEGARPHAFYEAWLLRKLCEEADEFSVAPDEPFEPDEPVEESPPPSLPEGEELPGVAPEEGQGEPTAAGVAAADVQAHITRFMATLGAGLPPEPEPDVALAREKYRELGLDPDELLPAPEEVVLPEEPSESSSELRLAALIRRRLDKPAAGLDLSGAPLQRLDLQGADFRGALLTDACFADANLQGARFDGAILARADLRGASLRGASLRDADLTEIQAAGADLTGAVLDGASGSHAVFTRAVLRGASLVGAELEACDLTEADLREARLDGADLVGSVLDGAGLVASSLIDTSLESVRARGAVFERARMPDLRASDGADFTGANFVLVDAPRAQLQGAVLTDASFAGSNLEEADLSDAKGLRLNLLRCVLRRAKLDRAQLPYAVLLQADLFEASLEEAELSGADARGAHLHTAHVWRARREGTLLEGAVLARTLWEGS